MSGWRAGLHQFVPAEGDIYEFGVFTGQSMVDIVHEYNKMGHQPKRILGFDSFEGLPEETQESDQQECWKKGEFSGQDHFGVDTVDDCMRVTQKYILDRIKNTEVILVPGYYEDSLNRELIDSLELQPASYVDIDVDLYSSTITVLDFMFSNALIVPGTVIGYDDWGGAMGFNWNLAGESRAHKEMCDKWGVKCKELYQVGNAYPHVAKVFKVL